MLAALLIMPMASFALMVQNPEQIQVQGLVSFGEDGAAWLNYMGHEMLVTSGYMIGSNLRVVAIRHDSVVLYRPKTRQYHVLLPKSELAHKDRNHVIWTQPMPVWKSTRMVGLAYRKDYIAHYQTQANNLIRRHVRNLPSMMELIVSPHHRFYARKGIVYVAPVHIKDCVSAHGWKYLMDRIQKYRNKTLGEWFPNLNKKGTIISDGKPLDHVLQTIAYKSGVRIIWQRPVPVPVYCSLRDKSWHEILKTIIVFNGFDVQPTTEGLVVR